MKSLFSKKSVLISVIAVLLIGTGVVATLAYLSDKEGALINTFTVGNVTTEIEEDVFEQKDETTFSKEPVVVNTGENDCYVRARVTCSPEEALELQEVSSNWTLKEDGFYYYNDKLLAGKKTDPIFKEVKVTDTSIEGFEVTVYQEAVQTIVYAEDGSFTENVDKIWKCYDKQTVPESFK